ncbi:MAG: dihydrofolate reductase [Pseudomonadota bacterium]
MTRIAFVVAVARNGVIGRNGALPWRIPADLKWFKSVTMGKPIVMGRKTFDSIGRPLPGRENIIVTRDESYTTEGVVVAHGLEPALAAACKSGPEEVCIIGGAEIYAALLSRADRIYLTQVEADVEGDATFPALDVGAWAVQEAGAVEAGPEAEFSCRFIIMDRAR